MNADERRSVDTEKQNHSSFCLLTLGNAAEAPRTPRNTKVHRQDAKAAKENNY
jgi:hypothetical protein